jgi:hypothetical protein
MDTDQSKDKYLIFICSNRSSILAYIWFLAVFICGKNMFLFCPPTYLSKTIN